MLEDPDCPSCASHDWEVLRRRTFERDTSFDTWGRRIRHRILFEIWRPDASRIDVEIDHSHWHAGAAATQRDKSRDNQVRLLSWEPMRFTEDDVARRLAASAELVASVHRQRRHLVLPPTVR